MMETFAQRRYVVRYVRFLTDCGFEVIQEGDKVTLLQLDGSASWQGSCREFTDLSIDKVRRYGLGSDGY